jgi:hypothetical protein
VISRQNRPVCPTRPFCPRMRERKHVEKGCVGYKKICIKRIEGCWSLNRLDQQPCKAKPTTHRDQPKPSTRRSQVKNNKRGCPNRCPNRFVKMKLAEQPRCKRKGRDSPTFNNARQYVDRPEAEQAAASGQVSEVPRYLRKDLKRNPTPPQSRYSP